jgi:hypothetical protein
MVPVREAEPQDAGSAAVTLEEAVPSRRGGPSGDAEEYARRADEDAARAEDEGYPLGRGDDQDLGPAPEGAPPLTPRRTVGARVVGARRP